MLFNVENVGETFFIDDNEIYITDFKFALDRLTVSTDTDIQFETVGQISAIIFAYNEELDGDRLIVEVGMGINDDIGVNGYSMFLAPVPDRASIFDEDFFGENTNYSVIIKGSVNGSEFEFKSNTEFEKIFSFNRVQLNKESETIVLTKIIDAATVFTDDEGIFINPAISENSEMILNNIQNNLQLEAKSEDVY